MYNDFFGLRESPFGLTPDPEFLFLTEQHRDALAVLTYAILAHKGIVLLTGNAGTGKTTLVRRILEHLPESKINFSVVVHPTLAPEEFLEATLLDFGIEQIPASKAQRIAALRSFLWKTHREGKIAALIVDEAHKLSPEVLEEIRLLGNFESASRKLLQIILVGQNELDDMLSSEGLRQFKQRISLRLAIGPLSASEIGGYIQHRWAKGGGGQLPFSSEAVEGIADASNGLPRVINVICDNALAQAFGEKLRTVDFRHVVAACREMRYPEPKPKQPVVIAPAAPQIQDYFPLKTLERYAIAEKRPSLLLRLALRLGFIRRIQTA